MLCFFTATVEKHDVPTRGIPCSEKKVRVILGWPLNLRYGGQEHMEAPRELIFAQNENYVECGAQG